MEKEYKTFKDFYPYYLAEHSNKVCRILHYIGSSLVLILLAFIVYTQKYSLFFILPICGYGFAWAGHFFFEKNRPATFKYPLYSFLGDWVMFYDMLTFKKR
tara:strand:- start:25637 stop:25939 length:303 start_codon:yes stop_codon:yes gene_type:complete